MTLMKSSHQALATLTNEIILEPRMLPAYISETIQATTQNSACCLFTRQGLLSREKSFAGPSSHGYWSFTMHLGRWPPSYELQDWQLRWARGYILPILPREQEHHFSAPSPQASLCIFSPIVLYNKTLEAKFANSLEHNP